MAKSLRSVIKAFFQTGDVPTEAQYVDTIDSSVYWQDDVETNLTSNSDLKVPTIKAVVDGLNTNTWASTLVNASLTASNSTQYIVVASATFTDPSPVQGKGFKVYVRNGTATVGGVAYSVAGSVIWRVFHSGAWANYYSSPFNDATSSIQTQIDVVNITITTSTSITTNTLDVNSVNQHGHNVMINNGASAINLTVETSSTASFCASYTKLGSAAITFVQGSGATLVQMDGTAVLNGAVGSTACLTRTGNTYYLQISNR
jgi:hypothetical protein